jgi:hypothetical protein
MGLQNHDGPSQSDRGPRRLPGCCSAAKGEPAASDPHLEFAQHMAADAKILDEDEETGAQKFRYIRTGPDHFSLAFTYAWMAASRLADMWDPKIIWF